MQKKYTKFEKARIIGARALQISLGAPPMIEIENLTNPIDIAIKEFEENVLPIDIEEKKY